MAEAFYKQRGEVEESAEGAMGEIEQNESFSARVADPGEELVERLVGALQQFDGLNGGFGAQPKFPHSGAIDLLLDTAGRGGVSGEAAGVAALMTLGKMSRGGIYDHLAGGFHRYSVDEGWVVPHFEKMAYDNSELLKNYVRAYRAFGREEDARVARDVMRWMNEWLSDRELGGFYGSQDADFSLEDDGDYFTWTRGEAAEVLDGEELALVCRYFNVGEVGHMHHNAAKNVLHVTGTLEHAANAARVSLGRAAGVLEAAKGKMYAARLLRATPYVDRTVYSGWNGMSCSAYLEAGRVLGEAGATAFALKTLDRVLGTAWDGGLARVVAYGEGGAGGRVAGVLEDYVFVGTAALDAWEAKGEIGYFEASLGLMEAAVERFYDFEGEAFFDTERSLEPVLGALSARRKPLQDSPTPAGNPVAASLLFRLEALTGREDFGVKAQRTLENFAGLVEHFGLYAASYGMALRRMIEEPVQVCVIGADEGADELERAALRGFAVNRSVVRLRRDQLGRLPPALAQTLPFLPEMDGSFAVVCMGNRCMAPVQRVAELMGQITLDGDVQGRT